MKKRLSFMLLVLAFITVECSIPTYRSNKYGTAFYKVTVKREGRFNNKAKSLDSGDLVTWGDSWVQASYDLPIAIIEGACEDRFGSRQFTFTEQEELKRLMTIEAAKIGANFLCIAADSDMLFRAKSEENNKVIVFIKAEAYRKGGLLPE
ncbi:hypothetical protein HUU05_28140 [candidate division KSB1 bacterium]|nr:hypothetical protein [candidate division KSB1 bacterium]